LAFWLGRRPANRRYTYGYGRFEDLAGVFVVLTVAAAAVVSGWVAVTRLIHPQQVGRLGWVGVAGLVGFLGNELVARFRIRVGRRIGSAALEADGFHARTDGVTSLAVVAAAVGVALGWKRADAILGLAVTAAILVVVKNAARDIYRRLMDAVDPAVVARVLAVLAATPGVEAVDAVRVRWVGHELHAEAEIVSDAYLSLAAAHGVAEEARHRLIHQVARLTSVTIHTSPCGHHGDDPHDLTAHHFVVPA
jgi:cation diffusion facilitator family transporter